MAEVGGHLVAGGCDEGGVEGVEEEEELGGGDVVGCEDGAVGAGKG